MARRMMSHAFTQAAERGPYDDYPILPEGVDPQLHLSRNDRAQPFYLICEKDTVLIQMSGEAKIRFRDSSVNYFSAVPGDHIYVPAGTPHRIEPDGEAVQYRVKAEKSGLEAVAWFCSECDGPVWGRTWDTADELPQEGYLAAVEAFNSDPAKRRCSACGEEQAKIDLGGFRWRAVIDELRAPAEEEEEAW